MSRSVPLLLALSLVGCGTRNTGGELGRAQFAWDGGAFGCLFGCNAAAPMATRATAGLLVTNYKNLPAFTVSSDDPSVLEFAHDGTQLSGNVRATSHRAGSAKLTLSETGSGAVLDLFQIEVRDVQRIEPEAGQFTQQLTLAVDGSKQMRILLYSSDGAQLKGVGAVDYAFSGGLGADQLNLVSAIAEALASLFTGTTTEYAKLNAKAVGSGTLTVSAPSGVALVVPAAVVTESAITQVTLEQPEAGTVGSYIDLDVQASSGVERVWSPPSKWRVDPADGPVSIGIGGRDYVSLKGNTAGSATVTCTLNGISANRMVTFAP